jgi:hypothetical protein
MLRPPTPVQLGIDLLAPGGSLRLVGVSPRPVSFDPFTAITKETTIRTGFIYVEEEFAQAVLLLASGAVDVDTLTTAVVPLERFADAFAALRQPESTMKVLIGPKQGTGGSEATTTAGDRRRRRRGPQVPQRPGRADESIARARLNETPPREWPPPARFSEADGRTPSQRIWSAAGRRCAAEPSPVRRDTKQEKARSGGRARPSLVELRPPAALLAVLVQRAELELRQVQRDQLLVGSVRQVRLEYHLEPAGSILQHQRPGLLGRWQHPVTTEESADCMFEALVGGLASLLPTLVRNACSGRLITSPGNSLLLSRIASLVRG